MKKVLLASTMLVATGGMAAADITFNGFGRFGLYYQETDADDISSTRVEQRFRLNIVGSATSDGGVEFGARIRLQSDENGSDFIDANDNGIADPGEQNPNYGNGNAGTIGAPEFNVQAGGFRLDVGNTSDVIDSGDVVDYYGYGVGLTSFIEQSSGFGLPASGFGNGGNVPPTIKGRYATGDFTVAASYTDNGWDGTRQEWQVGFGYNFGNYSAGIAFGNEDIDGNVTGVTAGLDNDFWAASFGGTIGSVGFSLLVADSDAQDDTSFGASVLVPVGASTEIIAAVADNGFDGDDTAYGIGVRHSLGGGVSLRGGIGENNSGDTVADLGVIFNF